MTGVAGTVTIGIVAAIEGQWEAATAALGSVATVAGFALRKGD